MECSYCGKKKGFFEKWKYSLFWDGFSKDGKTYGHEHFCCLECQENWIKGKPKKEI